MSTMEAVAYLALLALFGAGINLATWRLFAGIERRMKARSEALEKVERRLAEEVGL